MARIWSSCVGCIAGSEGQVSEDFRPVVIEGYLVFILELGWQPSEVYSAPADEVEGLDVWCRIFLVFRALIKYLKIP